jgi:hypothetical protein
MRIRFYLIAVLSSVLLAISACSSMQSARHEYLMRGQVVEISGSEAVVCIGSKDGAQVGQELVVYKLVSRNSGGSPKNSPPRWERVEVGSVRIMQVIDEHFATAQVVSGPVEVNHVVELNR